MPDREHVWIPRIKQQLADKKIDRREFIRYATLLGMSSGAAYSSSLLPPCGEDGYPALAG